jgi:hypothetical protein
VEANWNGVVDASEDGPGYPDGAVRDHVGDASFVVPQTDAEMGGGRRFLL